MKSAGESQRFEVFLGLLENLYGSTWRQKSFTGFPRLEDYLLKPHGLEDDEITGIKLTAIANHMLFEETRGQKLFLVLESVLFSPYGRARLAELGFAEGLFVVFVPGDRRIVIPQSVAPLQTVRLPDLVSVRGTEVSGELTHTLRVARQRFGGLGDFQAEAERALARDDSFLPGIRTRGVSFEAILEWVEQVWEVQCGEDALPATRKLIETAWNDEAICTLLEEWSEGLAADGSDSLLARLAARLLEELVQTLSSKRIGGFRGADKQFAGSHEFIYFLTRRMALTPLEEATTTLLVEDGQVGLILMVDHLFDDHGEPSPKEKVPEELESIGLLSDGEPTEAATRVLRWVQRFVPTANGAPRSEELESFYTPLRQGPLWRWLASPENAGPLVDAAARALDASPAERRATFLAFSEELMRLFQEKRHEISGEWPVNPRTLAFLRKSETEARLQFSFPLTILTSGDVDNMATAAAFAGTIATEEFSAVPTDDGRGGIVERIVPDLLKLRRVLGLLGRSAIEVAQLKETRAAQRRRVQADLSRLWSHALQHDQIIAQMCVKRAESLRERFDDAEDVLQSCRTMYADLASHVGILRVVRDLDRSRGALEEELGLYGSSGAAIEEVMSLLHLLLGALAKALRRPLYEARWQARLSKRSDISFDEIVEAGNMLTEMIPALGADGEPLSVRSDQTDDWGALKECFARFGIELKTSISEEARSASIPFQVVREKVGYPELSISYRALSVLLDEYCYNSVKATLPLATLGESSKPVIELQASADQGGVELVIRNTIESHDVAAIQRFLRAGEFAPVNHKGLYANELIFRQLFSDRKGDLSLDVEQEQGLFVVRILLARELLVSPSQVEVVP